MKHKMGTVTIEEFLGLKPKMLLSNATEYKKAKCVNKNVAAKISHNEYKNVLLNVNKNVLAKISHNQYKNLLLNKFLRHSMSRIQSKTYRIGNKMSSKLLPCFDDKIYILDNQFYESVFGV